MVLPRLFGLFGMLQGGQFEVGYGAKVNESLGAEVGENSFGALLQRKCLAIVFAPGILRHETTRQLTSYPDRMSTSHSPIPNPQKFRRN